MLYDKGTQYLFCDYGFKCIPELFVNQMVLKEGPALEEVCASFTVYAQSALPIFISLLKKKNKNTALLPCGHTINRSSIATKWKKL